MVHPVGQFGRMLPADERATGAPSECGCRRPGRLPVDAGSKPGKACLADSMSGANWPYHKGFCDRPRVGRGDRQQTRAPRLAHKLRCVFLRLAEPPNLAKYQGGSSMTKWNDATGTAGQDGPTVADCKLVVPIESNTSTQEAL